MIILKNTWFCKFAQKSGISDDALLDVVRRIELGQIDADLGGGVLKMRVARKGRGRSAGFRVIVLMKLGDLILFVFGFAKSNKSTLTVGELEVYKKLADHVLSLSDAQIQALLDDETFKKIDL